MTNDQENRLCNPQAEAALLGAMIADGGAGVMARAWDAGITHEACGTPAHQVVYAGVRAMRLAGEEPVDELTLGDWLSRRTVGDVLPSWPRRRHGENLLEIAGGAAAIDRLTGPDAALADTRALIKIVMDCWTRRRLAAAARELTRSCAAPGDRPPGELMDAHIAGLERIIKPARGRELNGAAAMAAADQKLRAARESGSGGIAAARTGIRRIDALTGGFEPGQFGIIGADPKAGKTALMLKAIEHITVMREEGVGSLVFSNEMAGEDLAMRLACQISKADLRELKKGDTVSWPNYQRARAWVARAPLWFFFRAGMTPGMIKGAARRYIARHPEIAVVWIDHIGRLSPDGRESSRYSTNDKSDIISLQLQQAAIELNVPVIALWHLNRRHRNDNCERRPRAADLRYGGGGEADCDKLILIWKKTEDPNDPDGRQAIVALNRHGPVSYEPIPLLWTAACARFDDAEKIDPQTSLL